MKGKWQDLPDDRKREWGIDMNEQGGDLILIMEYKTIPPSNNSTGQGPMREAVAGDEESRARREEPKEDKVEDGHVVAEIEEEVMPGAFLVLIVTQGQEVKTLHGIHDVNPS